MEDADEGMTVYQLWYEFLKRTDPATWSDKVKRDFRGVLTMDFDSWFCEVRLELFAPYGPIGTGDGLWIKRQPVRRLFRSESTDDINFDTHMVLVVDLSQPHSVLEAKFKRHLWLSALVLDESDDSEDSDEIDLDNLIISDDLDAYMPTERKRGATPWTKSFALYPFEKRPDVEALRQVLYVHDLNEAKLKPHWKIGVKAKEKFKDLLPLMKLKKDQEPLMEQKEILNAKVGYLLARAKKINAGVVKGIFPAV